MQTVQHLQRQPRNWDLWKSRKKELENTKEPPAEKVNALSPAFIWDCVPSQTVNLRNDYLWFFNRETQEIEQYKKRC